MILITYIMLIVVYLSYFDRVTQDFFSLLLINLLGWVCLVSGLSIARSFSTANPSLESLHVIKHSPNLTVTTIVGSYVNFSGKVR